MYHSGFRWFDPTPLMARGMGGVGRWVGGGVMRLEAARTPHLTRGPERRHEAALDGGTPPFSPWL